MKFLYPVYNPCWQTIDVAKDWGLDGTTDLALVLQQPFKIACVRALFNQPHVFSYDPNIEVDFDQFDLVVISDVEYSRVTEIKQWIANNNIKRSVLALGGQHENDDFDGDHMLLRHYWIQHYLKQNQFVDTSGDDKPFWFDALLGARRPHRDYVMLAMTQSGLLQQSIVTYRSGFPGAIIDHQSQEFAELFPGTELQWPYVSANLNADWEVSNNVNNQVSFISPEQIYRRTYYSIVAETLGTGGAFFFSEKTIKAFASGRIFVLFGNANYLQRLRALGFQTFDSVLDESYDQCRLDFERFSRAWQQVEWLATQNPARIQRLLAPVLEHNRLRLQQLVNEQRQSMSELLQRYTSLQHWG
jgi:hypothetical protein